VGEATVHFGSFDAELAWRPGGLATLPAAPVTANRGAAGMDELLVAGCRVDDVLLTAAPTSPALTDALAAAGFGCRRFVVPGPPDHAVEERLASTELTGLPDLSGWAAAEFAVVPETLTAIRRLGLHATRPAVGVVAEVNSKVWSNELARRLGLPGTGELARSPEQLRTLVERFGTGSVVVKDPYGVSGRGALRITTRRILDTVVRYLTAQVARGLAVELLVQPFLDVAVDFSAHFVVGESASMTWLGVQAVDNHEFAYRGSGPVNQGLIARLDADRHQGRMAEVAAALYQAGYTGPVCVDGMLLRDGTVVPVLEINARRSMGLLNLRMDDAVRRRDLRSWLRCRGVSVSGEHADDPAERLVDQLDAGGLLYSGQRAAVLPLASGTLDRPRGRLFYAVFATDEEQMRSIEDALTVALQAFQAGTRG
jgi:hypothetical protein